MAGQHDDAVLAARKFDDVIGHGQRPDGRGCRKAVLHQVVFCELPLEEGLGFGMSRTAYPSWTRGDELPGVRQSALTVEARKRCCRLCPGRPAEHATEQRGAERPKKKREALHDSCFCRFLRLGSTI